jgi:hypothetical protein
MKVQGCNTSEAIDGRTKDEAIDGRTKFGKIARTG